MTLIYRCIFDSVPAMNNVSEVCDLTEVCDFTDNTYSAGFLSVLHDLQRSNDFTDVVLCSGDAQFSCHRVVLSAASPYFRAMFASGKCFFFFCLVKKVMIGTSTL